MLNLHDAQRGFVGSACSLVSTPSMDVMAKLAAGSGPLINQYPSWVLLSGGVPATLDIDFVNDQAWNSPNTATISSLLTCSRASTGYYTKADGTLTSFLSNVLRYGSNGLLVEEARTNIALQSNTFGTTWTATGITNLTNTIAGPDGVSGSATLLNETTGNSEHKVAQSITKAASNIAYTCTAYGKQGPGRTRFMLNLQNAAGDKGAYAVFDLAGAQIGVAATTFGGVGWSSASAKIEVNSDGFYRCHLTATSDTDTTVAFLLKNDSGSGTGALSQSYAGTVGNGCYIYGAQLEAGSFATSYIPTTTASATRAADVVTMAYSGSSTGTLYGQYQLLAVSAAAVQDVGALYTDSSNYIALRPNTTTPTASLRVQNGGATQAALALTPVTTSLSKFAAAYSVNDFAGVLNGGSPDTDASGTVPTTTTLSIGSNASTGGSYLDGYLKRFAFWNTRLANSALQTLTT